MNRRGDRGLQRPGGAKNVMLRSFRSKMARNLEQKYQVDWKTPLGEGAYGKVYLAMNINTKENVALKKIDKRHTDTTVFQTETKALLEIHKNNGHPNICGLKDMYEDKSYYFLVFDLVPGGEMFEHLINYGAYSEADASRLMREVASALAFLHGINVVHADLKPENIMISSDKTSDGMIKIVDFGSAVSMSPDERTKKEGRKSFRATANGTTAYWSPERFNLDSLAGPPVDMWGVGVVLFIMLAGVHPYDLECNATDDDIAEKLLCEPNPPVQGYLDDISDSAVDLITRLLCPDPNRRLTADEMLEHPWVMGETALDTKITDSGRKLSRYERFRDQIEAGIFQAMVTPVEEMGSSTDIIKKAFDVFDEEGKGCITSNDIGNIVDEQNGDSNFSMRASMRNTKDMNFSEFSSLALNQLKYKHYKKNDIITRCGEIGDAMYFIRSGNVELLTESGAIVISLRTGEFFGEECILEEGKLRSLSALCATPVDVIEITRDDYNRFSSNSSGNRVLLETAFIAKTLANAKSLIRCCNNINRYRYQAGTIVYNEGSTGNSMYLLEEGKIDITVSGKKSFSLKAGEVFGEGALLSMSPRESTAVCVEDCTLSEIRGIDFLPVLESSPDTANALRDINRKRLFKIGVANAANRSFSLPNLRKAFDAVDENGDGYLNFKEISQVVLDLYPDYPKEEMEELMRSIDMNSDSEISFKEFEQIFKWCV